MSGTKTLVLAMAGLVGPLMAAVMMPVSSLAVILSSAWTRTFVVAGRHRRGRDLRPRMANASLADVPRSKAEGA